MCTVYASTQQRKYTTIYKCFVRIHNNMESSFVLFLVYRIASHRFSKLAHTISSTSHLHMLDSNQRCSTLFICMTGNYFEVWHSFSYRRRIYAPENSAERNKQTHIQCTEHTLHDRAHTSCHSHSLYRLTKWKKKKIIFIIGKWAAWHPIR